MSSSALVITRYITWRGVMSLPAYDPPHGKRGQKGATEDSDASQASAQGGQADDHASSVSLASEQEGG